MKKSVFFFFIVLIMTFLCVPAFAATGFYAMELDNDDGVVMAGDFKELDWRGDRPIILVFFQDGVPVQKTDLQLDGLERDTDAEIEYEDQFTPSTGTYQYANCIVVLDNYKKGHDIGKVYYNSASVNFKRTEPYFKMFEYDDEDEEWSERNREVYSLRASEENEAYYANFYYADILLDVDSVSFEDNQGNTIDPTIISASYENYNSKKKAWLITYTQNVSGKAIISAGGNLYEMPVNIRYNYFFKDQFDNKITEFLYVPGYNETFYLYGVTDTITEVTGGNNVSVVQNNGIAEFTIDSCTDEFIYSIEFGNEELEITIKPIVQNATAAGFYAIEVDEDMSIGEEKISEVGLRKDETISLIFFENDVLLERSSLEIDGLYRNALEEAEYDTYFADNVVVIDGFLDEKDAGTVSYNGSEVNFVLKGLTYITVEFDEDENEWSESKSKKNYLRSMKGEPYYTRFYYDDVLLDVDSISFEDNNGDPIDTSIIKAEYNQDGDAWLITYTANIKGKAVIKTTKKDYEMDVNISGLDLYFGDENREEYDNYDDEGIYNEEEGFIYEKGVNEVFYLYNYNGTITEVEGGDNVSFVKEDGRIKFTVDNCSDSFHYVISLDSGDDLDIEITAVEYSFFALEVIVDDVSGTFTVSQERLKEINLVETEKKYFVFSNERQKILIQRSENVNVELSTNPIFAGTSVDGYVYEVFFNGKSSDGTITNRGIEIIVNRCALDFYEYIERKERFDDITEFYYEKDVTEEFYLYIEEFPLQVNEVNIVAGQNYVSLSDVTLTVDDEDINVVKITVDDTVSDGTELTVYIPKWDLTKSITIVNESAPSLPLRGIYTDYINMTESTFCGEEECIYVAGDVFYYLWEEVDSCIDKDSKIKADADVNIDLIDTGRDVTLNGVTYDRYAIKITIPADAEGELSGDFTLYYINSDGERKKDKFELNIEDAYDFAQTGEEWLNYNGKKYVIGFTNDGEYTTTLNEYYNGYLAHEEGISHVENIPVKIFSITETEVGDEEVEAYNEVLDLYKNIKDIDIYVAEFNPRTLQYEKASAAAANCVSVTQSKASDGRWYANITNENIPGEYYIVAEVTMDDNTQVVIAMKYESTKLIEETLDLSQQTWGIKEINEYIENVNSDANIINIKLNPAVAYGAGADDKQLVLQGDKEYHIDGNGSTITGSVEAISPVERGKAPYHQLTNIQFISDKSSIDDTTNICLDGTGQILARKCTFKNYYIASNMFTVAERKIVYGVKNAMDSCIFENNKFGIYIDGKGRERRLTESVHEVKNCKFINNYTGIHIIEQEAIDKVEELLKFYHCEFIDNTYDIINKSDYKYMAYGCVFAKTSDVGIEARDPKTQKIEKSYVYRQSILNFDNNGFIDGEPTLPKVAYAPLTIDGVLDSFTFDNLKKIGINVDELKGAIKVVGEYILDVMDYLKLGTWKF